MERSSLTKYILWNRLIGLFLLFIWLILACNDSNDIECVNIEPNNEQTDTEYVEFSLNKNKWSCLAFDNYNYTHIERNMLCFGRETKIVVKNGNIQDTIVLKEGAIPFACSIYSIESLFFLIEEAIDEDIEISFLRELNNNTPLYRAYKIEITYDIQYGVPLTGRIDYIGGLADEEFAFEIIEFATN